MDAGEYRSPVHLFGYQSKLEGPGKNGQFPVDGCIGRPRDYAFPFPVFDFLLFLGDGMAQAGDFIWRPAGNRHEAYSPDGCLILGFFLKPNKFL